LYHRKRQIINCVRYSISARLIRLIEVENLYVPIDDACFNRLKRRASNKFPFSNDEVNIDYNREIFSLQSYVRHHYKTKRITPTHVEEYLKVCAPDYQYDDCLSFLKRKKWYFIVAGLLPNECRRWEDVTVDELYPLPSHG